MTMKLPPNGSVIYFIVQICINYICKWFYHIDIDLCKSIAIERIGKIPTLHSRSTILFISFISLLINVSFIQLLTSWSDIYLELSLHLFPISILILVFYRICLIFFIIYYLFRVASLFISHFHSFFLKGCIPHHPNEIHVVEPSNEFSLVQGLYLG